MTRHLSVGVVGHVDHGKTTLVKALTGMETDRLEEEKRRGLSIVLGFAFAETKNGIIDFIDAPGHESFVRTMISGATGIDLALLVIDANEGIKPQTLEHVRIVSLLGIDRAVVALSKIDIADAETVENTKTSVNRLLDDNGLAGAPIVPVSGETGEGIAELLAALDHHFAHIKDAEDVGRFYLPFDRVFTMKGFGVVATGTLRAGSLSLQDEGVLHPSDQMARVRGLQVHGQTIESATPGQRVAVNLRYDGTTPPERGFALASPNWLGMSDYWDASFHLLDDFEGELKNGAPLRLLHGTVEQIVRLRLIDRDTLQPGDEANVQFRLSEPRAAWDREHYIIRSITPVTTIGGGRFLNTSAPRRKRFDEDEIVRLNAYDTSNEENALIALIEEAGRQGVPFDDLLGKSTLTAEALKENISQAGCGFGDNGLVIACTVLETLKVDILQAINRFHDDFPTKSGMQQKEITTELKCPPSTFVIAADQLKAQGDVTERNSVYRITSFDPFSTLSDKEKQVLDEIENHTRRDLFKPPELRDVTSGNAIRKSILDLLIESGRVIPVYNEKRTQLFAFHQSAVDEATSILRNAFPKQQPFRVSDARECLDSSRKYVMPLLLFLDTHGVTRRKGEFRTIK